MPTVSIVIPCLNERDYILPCLETISKQTALDAESEILVLDGMSSDGTRDLILSYTQQDPRVKLLDNPARIQAAAMNIGMHAAHGEVLVRMDVHTEYDPDYVRIAMETLARTGATNVGGPTRTKWRTAFQQANSAAFHHPFTIGGAACHLLDVEGYVDNLYLGCWEREKLIELGGYDEDFIRNEDDELNLRILKSGGKVWQNPNIKFWYYPRSDYRSLWRQYFQYGFWKVPVMMKHNQPAKLRHLVPGLFVLFVLSLLPAMICAVFGVHLPLIAWSAIALLYMLLVVYASISAAGKAGGKVLRYMPGIICCYHLAYGVGYWAGVWHFLLRRKSAQESGRAASGLTR